MTAKRKLIGYVTLRLAENASDWNFLRFRLFLTANEPLKRSWTAAKTDSPRADHLIVGPVDLVTLFQMQEYDRLLMPSLIGSSLFVFLRVLQRSRASGQKYNLADAPSRQLLSQTERECSLLSRRSPLGFVFEFLPSPPTSSSHSAGCFMALFFSLLLQEFLLLG